jgi:transposase
VTEADHQCEWRERVGRLEADLEATKTQLANLQRHVFGKRSEKMPPVSQELARDTKADRATTTAKRRENAAKKAELPEQEVRHGVAEEKRVCPSCKGGELKPLGEGKVSYEYEFVPARFVRRRHIQETLACTCGAGIVTADPPMRVFDKAVYGPGFLAHVVVSKCGDSIPFYRLAKQYSRIGVPIPRSTLIDLFHRTASLCAPLHERMMQLIAESEIVHADETTVRVQAEGKCRTSWIWTFIGNGLIGYRYSASRSGATPAEVLGTSKGALIVDAYTGYNRVTTPEGRLRHGCWAHGRRRFFEARAQAPEAQFALDRILDLYRVEHEARARAIVGTPEHQSMRRERSAAILADLQRWLGEQKRQHLPKSAIGEAIAYTTNNWEELTRFIDDARVPLDNNISERALRVVALGRKNYLFVGHDQAGENTAALYSLVSSCEARGINPIEYLTDVVLRVQTHPHSRIDELLPHRWTPPALAAQPDSS